MNDKLWEELEHTSDIELEIRGQTEAELFVNSAYAIMAQIVDASTVNPVQKHFFRLQSNSPEERYLDWLRELLFLATTRGFLTCNVSSVALENEGEIYKLEAAVEGEYFDSRRHSMLHEVKTVTYQDFFFGNEGTSWKARVVFDV